MMDRSGGMNKFSPFSLISAEEKNKLISLFGFRTFLFLLPFFLNRPAFYGGNRESDLIRSLPFFPFSWSEEIIGQN